MAPLAAPSSTTPWAFFIAVAYLIFLIVRDESLGGEEALLLEFSNTIEADACKSPLECGPRFKGTTPFTDPDSGRMVWRSGNKVWVKIDGNRQMPMIIYDRIYPSREDDSRWTAIDNGRRMQELDLSNAAIYSSKPFRFLHKEAFEGLTAKEREDAMKASYEIVKSHNGGLPIRSLYQLKVESKKGAGNSRRNQSIVELCVTIGNAVVAGYPYKTQGLAVAGLFLGWRIYVWLGVGRAIQGAQDTTSSIGETLSSIDEAWNNFLDAEDK